ncbi:MAG: hypothetical protein EB116_13900 [Betaproteobacteria bacterium]|nr:hypothetical protein [Betaproteobacteria bacterium]
MEFQVTQEFLAFQDFQVFLDQEYQDLAEPQGSQEFQAFLVSLATVESQGFQAQAFRALADSAAIQAPQDFPASLDSAAFRATQVYQALAESQVTQALMA